MPCLFGSLKALSRKLGYVLNLKVRHECLGRKGLVLTSRFVVPESRLHVVFPRVG